MHSPPYWDLTIAWSGGDASLAGGLWRGLHEIGWFAVLLWAAVILLTAGLIVFAGTRWGRTRAFRKALGLSLLMHLVLVGFAATVQIVATYEPKPETFSTPIEVRVVTEEQRPTGAGPDETDTFGESEALSPWDPRTCGRVFPLAALEIEPTAIVGETDCRPAPRSRRFPPPEEADPSHPKPGVAMPAGPPPKQLAASGLRAAPLLDADAVTGESDMPLRDLRGFLGNEPVLMPDEPIGTGKRTEPARTRTTVDLLRRKRIESAAGQREATAQRDAALPHALIDGLAAVPASAPRRPASRSQRLVPAADSLPRQEVLEPADHRETDFREASLEHLQSPSLVGRRELHAERPPAGTVVDASLPGPRTEVPARAHVVPDWYRLRRADRRREAIARLGATVETEEAVRAALRWLAAVQADDGRWDADLHGAGREDYVAGRDRAGAGARADSGITGLALLAFLGSGHTHRNGPYQETVARGLERLTRLQAADGSLAGEASHYAQMYCHAMAALALSEAYNLTGDPALRAPIRAAVEHTIRMQNPVTGGWRYVDGEDGDMSQLGWQVLVLRSAEEGGLAIPESTKNLAWRFLKENAAGTHGGLAAYRAGYAVSRAMTAEAMLARLLLGEPSSSPAIEEATAYVLEEKPGGGLPNLYYWYYATLALQQQQNAAWREWNAALRPRLLELQTPSGPGAGSWSPETVWGGYGGRVYSTAMATLCLESYYRYAPPHDQRTAAKP